MKNIRPIIILSAIATLLLIPLIAMQFTDEVNWSGTDFLTMGILLVVTGISCELIMRRVKNIRNRIILCGTVFLVFFLLWAELAVGIFGTAFAGS